MSGLPFKPGVSPVEQASWRPINTAPRDGTLILAVYADDTVGVRSWVDYTEKLNNDEIHWRGWSDNGIDLSTDQIPIWWMPVPEPPDAGGEGPVRESDLSSAECRTCAFFDMGDEYTGECRRYAPGPYKHAAGAPPNGFIGKWPLVDPNDWCGEFRQRVRR